MSILINPYTAPVGWPLLFSRGGRAKKARYNKLLASINITFSVICFTPFDDCTTLALGMEEFLLLLLGEKGGTLYHTLAIALGNPVDGFGDFLLLDQGRVLKKTELTSAGTADQIAAAHPQQADSPPPEVDAIQQFKNLGIN